MAREAVGRPARLHTRPQEAGWHPEATRHAWGKATTTLAPEPTVSDLEGRVRDVERGQDRMEGRVGRLEEEMRAFRPIPLESAKDRGVVERLAEDVQEAHEAIRELRQELAEDRKDRVRVREEREAKDAEREEARRKEAQAQRMMLKVAAFGLFGTFLTSTAAVLAAVLGGGP